MPGLSPLEQQRYEDRGLFQGLQRAEAARKAAWALAEDARRERDRRVKKAVAAGWTHARVAEATGLTRGRVNQIVRGRR